MGHVGDVRDSSFASVCLPSEEGVQSRFLPRLEGRPQVTPVVPGTGGRGLFVRGGPAGGGRGEPVFGENTNEGPRGRGTSPVSRGDWGRGTVARADH